MILGSLRKPKCGTKPSTQKNYKILISPGTVFKKKNPMKVYTVFQTILYYDTPSYCLPLPVDGANIHMWALWAIVLNKDGLPNQCIQSPVVWLARVWSTFQT